MTEQQPDQPAETVPHTGAVPVTRVPLRRFEPVAEGWRHGQMRMGDWAVWHGKDGRSDVFLCLNQSNAQLLADYLNTLERERDRWRELATVYRNSHNFRCREWVAPTAKGKEAGK